MAARHSRMQFERSCMWLHKTAHIHFWRHTHALAQTPAHDRRQVHVCCCTDFMHACTDSIANTLITSAHFHIHTDTDTNMHFDAFSHKYKHTDTQTHKHKHTHACDTLINEWTALHGLSKLILACTDKSHPSPLAPYSMYRTCAYAHMHNLCISHAHGHMHVRHPRITYMMHVRRTDASTRA